MARVRSLGNRSLTFAALKRKRPRTELFGRGLLVTADRLSVQDVHEHAAAYCGEDMGFAVQHEGFRW